MVVQDLPLCGTSLAIASSGQPLKPSSLANGMVTRGSVSEIYMILEYKKEGKSCKQKYICV